MESEQVYTCNICDVGFDEEYKIRNYIESIHNDIVTQINKEIDEGEKSDLDESCSMNDSDLYAGFDEDGSRIVEDSKYEK